MPYLAIFRQNTDQVATNMKHTGRFRVLTNDAHHAANHRRQKAERSGAYCHPSEFALLCGLYFGNERITYAHGEFLSFTPLSSYVTD